MLGGIRIMYSLYIRQPSPDPAAVCGVLLPEGSSQSRLLVPHHEEVRCEKEDASITQKWQRLVEERRADQGKPCTNVHGITHKAVGTQYDQSAGRVEGRRSASSDRCEGQYA